MKRCPSAMVMRLAASISLVVASIDSINTTHASTWTGFDANWSSDGDPGWNGTGVPDGVGAVADNPIVIPATTTQDIAGGVTVGTISLSGSGDARWQVSLGSGSGITLNEDGDGPGHATISNSNSSMFSQLYIVGGTLTLADELLIENTGGSANTGLNNGAFRITSPIDGTGSVTFRNTAPTYPSGLTNANYPGATLVFNGASFSTFTGNVFVEKGLVLYQSPQSFGANSNVITMGKAGQGDAALLMTAIAPAGAQDINYDIVIAAGSGGVLTIGTISGSTSSRPTYTGTVTLNDNVRIAVGNGTSTLGSAYSGVISGVGGIEMIRATSEDMLGYVRFQGMNTYEGNTTITQGVLVADSGDAIPNSAGKGDVSISSVGTMRVNVDETINGLSGVAGAIVNNRNSGAARTLTIGDNDATSTYSGLIEDGGAAFNIAKTGAGTLTLDGANTYTGTTAVNGGTLLVNNAHTGGGDYNVGAGGTLGGSGTVSAPIFLDGSISPGTSPGTLTIGGLTANGGGTLAFDLDPANPNSTADDLLAVTGTAHLSAPTLNVNVTSAAFGGGQFSTPGSWLLVDGALLTGSAPTTVNFNFVEGLSGVTPSLDLDFINGDIRLVLAAGISGDYNNDGIVDAADYVLWRKDPNSFGGDPAGYNVWRANFGAGGGSGASLVVATQVPEPAGCVLLILSALLLGSYSRGGVTFTRKGM